MSEKKLLLIELNEVNFDLVKLYTKKFPQKFRHIEELFEKYIPIKTDSEKEYELLEPWIQWATIHTGLSYNEHRVFRLGDIINTNAPQIFEIVEGMGNKVGAISPMNASNRLINPAYFIPDPWTKTNSDNSVWSRILHSAVSQSVNDNAKSKITLKSKCVILAALIFFARSKNYLAYAKLFRNAKKSKWNKALILDLLLCDIHNRFVNKHNPNFSVLFLNSCAHIQHHYYHNSIFYRNEKTKNPSFYVDETADPIHDMLINLDIILREIFRNRKYKLIIATGLTQVPYDQLKYYYRLASHEHFLKSIGVNFKSVNPLMTRDFVINFSSTSDALHYEYILKDIRMESDGLPLFGECDNRGDSLFLTLTYPNLIDKNSIVITDSKKIHILEHVAFVAVKNGMHSGNGYAYISSELAPVHLTTTINVKCIFDIIKGYFLKNAA